MQVKILQPLETDPEFHFFGFEARSFRPAGIIIFRNKASQKEVILLLRHIKSLKSSLVNNNSLKDIGTKISMVEYFEPSFTILL